jgi:predicted metal-dependent hydrolase
MQTPDDRTIHPRNISFGRNETNPRWWLRNDPVATAFNNALSASFPEGERFFIDSVRAFKHRADPKLQEQITAFTAQESVHTREHLMFNKHIVDAGYDLTKIDRYLERQFRVSRRQWAIGQLAATAALEHFTAILANALLNDPKQFDGAAPHIADMWRWHAVEEIEHKAVAFDTYMAATKNWWPIARWALRCHVMFVSTILFFAELFYSVTQFFKQDGINTVDTWRWLFRYMFVEPGAMRKVARSYFKYYRPNFHPWNVDDHALAQSAAAELEAVYAPA